MKNALFFFLSLLVFQFATAQEIIWNKEDIFSTQNVALKCLNKPTTIIVNDKIEVTGTVETPTNVTIWIKNDGYFKIANEDARLIINGPIEAGKQLIFDVSARGVTSYRFESVSNIQLNKTEVFFPEWWGIMPNIIPGKNNNTPKDSHHVNLKEMMLDIASSGGGTIEFSEGVYYIRDIVVDSDNISVIGKGKNTILRFDRDNYGYSTRRGGLFTIQGATLEKYYSKVFPDGVPIAGNYLYDTEQRTIENILVKDLAIEWNEISTKEDPSMNGLTIVNARNVTIDNVHVNLFGANRAFYIGTIFEGDITENITIKNSSGINSRTGVFILHGYDSNEFIRRKMILGNIIIENNSFDIQAIPELDIKNIHIVKKYLDKYATGIYFIGNEFTKSFDYRGEEIIRSLGEVLIKNNIFKNADIGIRSWFPTKDPLKDYTHDVTIEDNTFIDFKYVGIFSPFKTAIIKGNKFKSKTISKLPKEFKDDNEEGFIASAIHIAKAPWKEFKTRMGPENILIEGNTIEGCYLGVSPIVLQPNEGGVITLKDNNITYDSSCEKPQNDVIVTTNRRKFRTKEATISLSDNVINLGNQNASKASILLDTRRKKNITLIEKE